MRFQPTIHFSGTQLAGGRVAVQMLKYVQPCLASASRVRQTEISTFNITQSASHPTDRRLHSLQRDLEIIGNEDFLDKIFF